MADDLGPVSVTVGVEDPATGQWWDPAAGTWTPGPVLTPADGPFAPGALAPTQVGAWRWPLDTTPLPSSGVLHARAADAAGRTAEATVTATVDAGDLAAPDTTITSPSTWANPPGVTLTGTAADNQSVGAVDVALQNLDTGQSWDAAAQAWATSLLWNPAAVRPTGGPTAQWTYPLALPVGRWHLRARATDGAGHIDPTPPQLSFRTG